MKTRIDATIIQHQITNLLVAYPELAEDEQLRADMVEGETELHEFMRNIEKIRRHKVAMAEGLSKVMLEFSERLRRYERREQGIRQLMYKLMEVADLKKLELPEATLSMRNGTAKVNITDEHLLPDIYCRIKREADKTKIKQALESGEHIYGAELSNSEPQLSIRTK